MKEKKFFLLALVLETMLLFAACDREEPQAAPAQNAAVSTEAAREVPAGEEASEADASGRGVQVTFDVQRMPTAASNQIALWVEDADGRVVRTVYASSFTAARRGYERRADSLRHWVAAARPDAMTDTQIDAVSSATLAPGHAKFFWDLKDDDGQEVPAGRYKLYLEGTLYWSSNILYTAELDTREAADGALSVTSERSEPENPENEDMLQNVTMQAVNF